MNTLQQILQNDTENGLFDLLNSTLQAEKDYISLPTLGAECPNGTIFKPSTTATQISCGRYT